MKTKTQRHEILSILQLPLKKIIFLQLSVAHKKQIQLPAKHKHDKALQQGIETSHVVPERGRSFYWKTVTPINKHKMSVQPGSQEQRQASPWWARRGGRAFPEESWSCCCSGTVLQAQSSTSTLPCSAPEQLSAAFAVWCTSNNQRNFSAVLEWPCKQKSLRTALLRWLRENNCR